MADKLIPNSEPLEEIAREGATRRDVFKTMGATALGAALFSSAGFDPALAQDLNASQTPLRAAFSNAGLQATWCAQGKQAAEAWGKLMNVDITWFDGELSATKQRASIDNMAAQDWDFVAIQTFGIGTLTDPIQKMIDKGTPVIAMDTLVAPPGTIDITTFIAPDNIMMGAAVTQQLMDAIGGKGNVVMTQGALGHSGAQGRAQGFKQIVANYPDVVVVDEQPADWDVTKVARIWDSVLTQNPEIVGAFFHNDDMALGRSQRDEGQEPRRHHHRRRRRDAAGGERGARRRHADDRAEPVLAHPRLVGRGGRRGGRGRRQGDGRNPGIHPRGRSGHHGGNGARPALAPEELPDVIARRAVE